MQAPGKLAYRPVEKLAEGPNTKASRLNKRVNADQFSNLLFLQFPHRFCCIHLKMLKLVPQQFRRTEQVPKPFRFP